jgi:sugar (pentulose or hexulose) kinase
LQEDTKLRTEDDLILAIDVGTQNIKAAVFDTHGTMHAIARLPQDPDSAPYPGWVEHDALRYWEKTCEAVREALIALGGGVKRLRAVGLTTLRGTTIPMDMDGRPLRPAIVYLDNRVNEEISSVRGLWKLFFWAIGRAAAIEYVRRHSRFLWIKQHEPHIYAHTYKFMQVASFLNYRLTGQINETIAMMVGMFPFDIKNLRFYPQKAIHEIFGVSPQQLPELKPPLSIVGNITPEAAKKTMIPQGLPVVVSGGDAQSAAIGMGATDEECAALVLGTAVVCQLSSKRYVVDKRNRFFPWPAAMPGKYTLEAGVSGGLITVTWFAKELAHYETQLGKESGKSPEQILDDAIRTIPPGSLGLIVHPYWTPSIHHEAARGSILGLTMAHSRAHIYRAILEGIAYEILTGLEAIQEKAGIMLKEIHVSGGGSQSDMVLSILADVFQVPTIRMRVSETTALGAAICAACGIGLFPSLKEGIDCMVHPEQRFDPNPENMGVYTTLYRCYQEVYPRIAEFYRRTEHIASPVGTDKPH